MTENYSASIESLAKNRTKLASTRTLLAYWRTALAVIVFGVFIIRFFSDWYVVTLAVLSVLFGLGLFGYGTAIYFKNKRSLETK